MPASDGVSIDVGVRVVRGPDWSSDFEDQDGGEGHIGSLVEICGQSEDDMYPKECAVVQWDNGERNVYRAGYEKSYDLRLYDNAGIGIKHDKSCTECNSNNVLGLLWVCQQCPNICLCTDCYGEDKHDIEHTFTRFDCPGDEGTNVPKRAMSKKVPAKGIFERSRVQRGPDWRWQNQDGGEDKEGEVIAIVNFSPDTDHDAVEVTWQNGYTNVYRLGYKGRLDVKCVKPAKGGYYYRDHLPTIKLDGNGVKIPVAKPEDTGETKPSVSLPEGPPSPSPTPSPTTQQSQDGNESSAATEGRFKNGDRVKIEIEVDILKMIEENRGAWNQHMTDCIGKTGTVIVSKGQDVTVDFQDVGRWTFHESVLNKVKEFRPGEVVQVKDSVDNVRMLQSERGGWNDQMVKIKVYEASIPKDQLFKLVMDAQYLTEEEEEVLGRKGTVEEVDDDGDVMVSFGGYTWTFNPESLMETEGPADYIQFTEADDTPVTPAKPVPSYRPAGSSRPPPATEEEKLEEFFGTIFAGANERFGRIIQRDPQLMLMDLNGEFAIHKAAESGNIDIATILLQSAGADTQLEIQDNEGNTPLLTAVKGGEVEMVHYLVETGSKKDAVDNKKDTAVHIATANRNNTLLKALRSLDFDINIKNGSQRTPLFEAIMRNDPEILSTVLGWPQLDVQLVDSEGLTPFMLACQEGNKRAVLGLLEIVPEELNRQNQNGLTGFHIAVQRKQLEITRVLINQRGIDVNLATKTGNTPLHLASEGLELDIVRTLVENGASVSLVNGKRKTCLHACVESAGSSKEVADILNVAKVLLEHDAPPDVRDSLGKLAVDYLSNANKEQFTNLVDKYSKSRSQPGKPRGQTDNLRSSVKQGMQQGSSSMIIPTNDPEPAKNQAQMKGEVDPELCEICEEEPPRYRYEPCRHMVCGDCKPGKKAKKKLCGCCGQPIMEVVEFDER